MVEPALQPRRGPGRGPLASERQVREVVGEARAALEGALGLVVPAEQPLSMRLRRQAWGWTRDLRGHLPRPAWKKPGFSFPYRHLSTLLVLVLLGSTLLGQGFGIYRNDQTAAGLSKGGFLLLFGGQDSLPLTEEAFGFAAAPMSVVRMRPAEAGPSTEGPVLAGSGSDFGRNEVVTYTVQAGDTLDSIAEQFQVAAYTLFWVNGLPTVNEVRSGMVLVIPPVSGVPHTVQEGETLDSIADMYGVRAGNIVGYSPNGLKYPYSLSPGQELFVPGGIIEIPPYRFEGGKRPAPTILKMPGGEKLRWPTWGEITAPFGYTRSYGRFHHGLDIANSWGTPIYAAAAGTVVEAGWGELGWYVIINHGNGFRTVYGHMAERPWVAEGDAVVRGQRIGSMGRTYGAGGYASGVHLHFAVRHRGVYIDPLPLLEN